MFAIKGYTIKERAARKLELPPEVALGTTKLVITGRHSLKAINHRGILVYQSERIVFKADQGAVEILGTGLGLAQMTLEYLRIEGQITSVSLLEEDHA